MEEEILHFKWGMYIFKILVLITIVGIPFGAFLNYITHNELMPNTTYIIYGCAAFIFGLASYFVIRKSTDNSKQQAIAGMIIPLPIIVASIIMLMLLPLASAKIEKIKNETTEKEAKSFAETLDVFTNPNPPDYAILTIIIFAAFNLAFLFMILFNPDKSGLILYVLSPIIYYIIYKIFVGIMNKVTGAIV